MPTLNDHWLTLFRDYHILERVREDGAFAISAQQIRAVKEPRLMTKFDHHGDLPPVFAENGLAILPVTRGDYLISTFEAYHTLERPSGAFQRVTVPAHLQSLAPQFQTSEAVALNCACACGIFEDFLQDQELVPTVSGRMGSDVFHFSIDTAIGPRQVKVEKSQIEIDAAVEGLQYLSLFEAKKNISKDFLIRQLYYPFRVWTGRIPKPVKPVFLVHTNGMFYLYEYAFEDPGHYNSLRLVRQKNYVIDSKITAQDIGDLLRTVPQLPEPQVPFPQADNLPRIVINLMELLCEAAMTAQQITATFGFTSRQTDYYTSAGIYLGLFCRERVSQEGQSFTQYTLTPRGEEIMRKPYRERQLAFIRCVLEHRVFRELMAVYLTTGHQPDKKLVIQHMKDCRLYGIGSESTYGRRALTITSWLGWITGLLES